MRKILLSTVASAILALTATASEDKIDRESFLATGQIYLAAQLLSNKSFDIELKVRRYGHTSMFDKMLGKEPNDENWEEELSLWYDTMICSTQEGVKQIKGKGVDIKAYVGDAAVVTMREAVKILKDDGAKYIFIEREAISQNAKNYVVTDMPFDKCFLGMITERYDSRKAVKTGWIVGEKNGESKDIYVKPAYLQIIQAPYKECSAGTDWSGFASTIAQVGFMALGVKGASSGNTNVASFSANAANVAASTGKSAKQDSPVQSTQDGENFAARAILDVKAVKSLDYFKNPSRQKFGIQAYVFPIEDVEKALAHYMDIPYSSKITYDGK